MVLLLFIAGTVAGKDRSKRTPKEALQALNDLIGSWRGTGQPEGTIEEKQRNFWTETQAWQWHFTKSDASLTVTFDKSRNFTKGELSFLPDKDEFQLSLHTPTKEILTFTGPLKEGVLTLERIDEKKKEKQRLVFTFLHANRFLYRYEDKALNQMTFKKRYQVGATKEGIPFASEGGVDDTECIVSGGHGSIAVKYKGKTYYVCCSGCREAFKEDPEKYIKEFEEKKAKNR